MSSCTNSGEMSCAKSDQDKSSTNVSSGVQVVPINEDGSGKVDCQSGDEQLNWESNTSTSSTPPVGAGRPQTQSTNQRKQKKQEKSPVELLWRVPEKSTGLKQRNNQQKMGQQSNISRGFSQTSLTGKMNTMSISDPRRPGQNGFQRNGNNAGQGNHNQQNRGHNVFHNNGRNQHQQWKSQQVVSQSNYQANHRPPMPSQQNQAGYAPNNCFPNSLNQINPKSPSELLHRQAFPPLHPGNEFHMSHRSAPNSPGAMMSVGHHNTRPDVPRSPGFPVHENVNTFHHFGGPSAVRVDFVQSPPPCMNERALVSPPSLNSAWPNHVNRRNLEHGNQQQFSGKKFQNGNTTGNQPKQGNKWRKTETQSPPLEKVRGESHPATTSQRGPVIPDMGSIPFAIPQYFHGQDVFVGQPNFVPVPNSMPPPMIPVTTAPFRPYVDEQQYPVALFQGGNFIPQQQWVPMAEGQGNFVPYTSAEMVPYTMGPGVIPFSTAPYSMPPNVLPFANGPAGVPFTAIPFTAGIPGHGFVPAVPPPTQANVNAQLLSFTVSSRVGPLSATTEAPKQQFKLSQLERAWEEKPSQQQLRNSGPAQTKENVSSPGDERKQLSERAGGERPQEGAAFLPETLKEMLDVSSLEKLQRMSSTNGKRAPMNARNKDSPNHAPAATPPDVQEEVIKFICDSWNKVYQEYQKGSPAVAFHVDSDPSTLPEGFVPFDLEAFWGKRLVQNMATQNIPTQNM